MDQRIRNTVAVCSIAVAGILSFAACKENTIINSNLVPTVDNIHTFEVPDSVTFYTKTVLDDSVVTSYNLSPVIAGLGTVQGDPFFGNFSEGLYFQMIPPTTSYSFPVARNLIDSAVIVLPYTNYSWADTSAAQIPQHVKAYRVLDSMAYDTAYYSFSRFAVDRNNPMGEAYGVTMAGMRQGDSTAPYLSIKMSSAYIDTFYNNVTTYASYPDFLKWFKGIAVESDTLGPGKTLHFFHLDGSGYHTTAGILFYMKDSVISAFGYNTLSCTHSTWVKRNFTGTPVQSYFNSTQQSDNYVMIQNEPGAAASIRFPYLKQLSAAMGKSLVNKAELVLTMIDTLSAQTYTEPGRIYPVGVSDTPGGTKASYSIADRYPLSSSDPLNFIDGSRQTLVVGTAVVTLYHVNFPRELQQALSQGRSELSLRINGTQTYVGAYRVIAGGRSHPTNKMQLHIVYSKIN